MLLSPEAAAVDRRIMAGARTAPAPTLTMDALLRHAEKWGADGVLEAAEQAGFGRGELLVLRARLARLPMRYGQRDGRRFPLPESVGRKLTAAEVSAAAAYLLEQGRTLAEAADELGISRAAAEKALSRGAEHLTSTASRP